jgi:hypothetical protein
MKNKIYISNIDCYVGVISNNISTNGLKDYILKNHKPLTHFIDLDDNNIDYYEDLGRIYYATIDNGNICLLRVYRFMFDDIFEDYGLDAIIINGVKTINKSDVRNMYYCIKNKID